MCQGWILKNFTHIFINTTCRVEPFRWGKINLFRKRADDENDVSRGAHTFCERSRLVWNVSSGILTFPMSALVEKNEKTSFPNRNQVDFFPSSSFSGVCRFSFGDSSFWVAHTREESDRIVNNFIGAAVKCDTRKEKREKQSMMFLDKTALEWHDALWDEK